MVGILVSFWEGLFSGAMLVSGRVGSLAKLGEFQNRLIRAFAFTWQYFAV